MEGFPGGSVVKNPPAKAGYTNSNPDLGRSHKPHLLSQCTTNIALALWSPGTTTTEARVPPQKEVRTPQLESSPHLLQLEKANMQQWRPRAARKKWSGSDFLIRAWGMPGSEQGAGQEGLGRGQWRLRACHPAQVGTGGSPGIIRVRKAR